MGTAAQLKGIPGLEGKRRAETFEFVDTVLLHCHQVKSRNKFGKKG